MRAHQVRDVEALDPHRRGVETERPCRPSSASVRCCRRRSARSLSWPSASCALRSASSRIRRSSPRSAARISTGPPLAEDLGQRPDLLRLAQLRLDQHQRRHRPGALVVLDDELLGHLHRPLAGVVEVERLAVGEHAVAHLEDLRVGVTVPPTATATASSVPRPPRWPPAGAPAASAPPSACCARAGRVLVLLLRGGPSIRSPGRASISAKRPERKAITPSIRLR